MIKMKLALTVAKLSINETVNDNFEITRSLPHGHICLILESIKKLKLDTIISLKSSRNRDLIMAIITARIINPASKLATARSDGGTSISNPLSSKVLTIIGYQKIEDFQNYTRVAKLKN